MTPRTIVDFQMVLNENQLRKVLVGLTDDSLDFRFHPNTSSLRDQLSHLCVTYNAVVSLSKGEEADWDSYDGEGKTLSQLESDTFEARTRALDAYAGKEDEESLKTLNDFIVLHDNYHIGQLSMLHLALDDKWDSFSLYS